MAGPNYLEKLEVGDEIWVIIDDECWLKRITDIVPQPDGSYSLTLEDGVEALGH